jgi:outer membrane protein assembly factor BamB
LKIILKVHIIITTIIILFIISCNSNNFKRNKAIFPTIQYNFQHTGKLNHEGPKSPKILWNYFLDDKITGYSAIVIDRNDNLYLSNQKNEMFSFNKKGNLRWRYTPKNQLCFDTYQIPAPLIMNDSLILYNTFKSEIICLNITGKVKWSRDISGRILVTPLLISDGLIISSDISGKVFSLNNNGLLEWFFVTNTKMISSSPATDNKVNNIYIGSNDKLICIDTKGNLIWEYGINGGIYCSIAVDFNENIYFGSGINIHSQTITENKKVGSYSQTDSTIYSLTQNGKLRWKLKTNGAVLYAGAINNQKQTAYYSSTDGYLYSININTGLIINKIKLDDGLPFSPIIDLKNNIYIGTSKGLIYSLNDKNELKWKIYIGGLPIYLSMNHDGTLYACGNNSVYALK